MFHSTLSCLGLVLSTLALPAFAHSGPRSGSSTPNVLLVILDDVGPDQLRCFDPAHGITGLDPGPNLYTGAYPYAPTPNLTQIAVEGVRFSRVYGSPVCSPTRAQLQTGRYTFRNGVGGVVTTNARGLYPPHNRAVPDLDLDEYLLPEVIDLFASSYDQAYFGKWHLAADKCYVAPVVMPDTEGDDHPFLSGWPHYDGIIRNLLSKPNPDSEGCIVGRPTYYDTFDVFTDVPFDSYVACSGAPPGQHVPPSAFNERHWMEKYLVTDEREDVEEFCTTAGEPWVAVWASQAAHGPWDWPPLDLHTQGPEPFDLFDTQLWLRYCTVIEAFDTEFGKLRAALEQGDEGDTLWDRTLVIVVSDNGTDSNAMRDASLRYSGILDDYVAPYDNGVNQGRFKGTIHLTGTSLILMAAGPGVADAGRVCDDLVDAVDVFATVLDYAGVPSGWESMMGLDGRTIDGLTLRPALENTGSTGRTFSFSHHYQANGPYDLPFPPYYEDMAYIYEATSGDIYRLLRKNGAADEFYHLWDSAGDPVDLPEANPLSLSHAEYAPASAALDALLATL